MKRLKKITLLFVFILLPIVIIWCNYSIASAAKNKAYSSVENIPYNRVGLLLGTSKYTKNNQVNLFYKYRIDAALALLKSGKIKYLIISGDNRTRYYDEPTTMKNDLIAAGIDSCVLFLDFAGFRTFDSIVRLGKVFGEDSVTIVSQKFHNERALFIAERENIEAIAFNAQDVSARGGFATNVREKMARVKVYLDFLTSKKPKFLGQREYVPQI